MIKRVYCLRKRDDIDDAKFIDFERSCVFMTEEHEIF